MHNKFKISFSLFIFSLHTLCGALRLSSDLYGELLSACNSDNTEEIEKIAHQAEKEGIPKKEFLSTQLVAMIGSIFTTPLITLLNNAQAYEKPDLTYIKRLLDLKVDVTKTNHLGQTALHLACQHENPQLISTIINLGADVNAQDNEGDSPLFYAIVYGNFLAVEILLQHNASKGITNHKNKTPLLVIKEIHELFDESDSTNERSKEERENDKILCREIIKLLTN